MKVRLESQNGTEGRTTDGNTARFLARMCLYCYRQIQPVHMYKLLLFVFVPCIHFFCRFSFIYYLQVQLMYLNELYRECNRTACACASSGYQALLSDFLSVWEQGYRGPREVDCASS